MLKRFSSPDLNSAFDLAMSEVSSARSAPPAILRDATRVRLVSLDMDHGSSDGDFDDVAQSGETTKRLGVHLSKSLIALMIAAIWFVTAGAVTTKYALFDHAAALVGETGTWR